MSVIRSFIFFNIKYEYNITLSVVSKKNQIWDWVKSKKYDHEIWPLLLSIGWFEEHIRVLFEKQNDFRYNGTKIWYLKPQHIFVNEGKIFKKLAVFLRSGNCRS